MALNQGLPSYNLPGVQGASALAIQGIAGAVPIPITGTISASTVFPLPGSGNTAVGAGQSTGIQAYDGAANLVPLQETSGALWVNVQNASIPVTGTFWQSTQPVSIATMPTTPVTGTFWQVTQPVSIASMPSTPVTGTFWPYSLGTNVMANSVPVTVASDQGALPVSFTQQALPANQSVNVTQVGGASLALGQTTKSASVPVTMASDSDDVDISMSDPNFPLNTAFVSSSGEQITADNTTRDLMLATLVEIRIQNAILMDGLNSSYKNLELMRSDPGYGGPAPL